MAVIRQVNRIKLNYSDLELVEGLSKEKDQQKLRSFQNYFFNKYKGYIYKIAINICRNYHDSEQFALDITQQTFIKAFENFNKFNLSRVHDQSKHTYILKAWLGKIANNCFRKEYAKRKNIVSFDDLESEPIYDEGIKIQSKDEAIEIPNKLLIFLDRAMDSLTEKQKHILLTYANEDCINSTLHLSNEAMKNLCKLYNTNPTNIRQIKKRTLDKVKKICFNQK